MDFNYTDQQRDFQNMVREFAKREIAPEVAERERAGKFDYGIYRRLGELGVTAMPFSEEFGGINADFVS